MKTIITSINTTLRGTVAAVLHTCSNAIALDGQKTETWARLGKWSEYPGQINLPGGVSRKGVQVLDREGAEMMRKQFHGAINQIAHLGKGLPIYEGHPDDPSWRKANPEVRKVAVGRIKELEIREDGPWVRCVFNERGVRLIGGDAPELSAHSPHFGLREMPGRSDAFQVVELRSIGLTNEPNMPDTAIGLNEESSEPETGAEQPNKQQTMKLNTDILKRLGLNPEASEDAVNSAINSALQDRESKTGEAKSTAEKLTAANERITTLQADADKFRDKLIDHELTTAINTGKITEADKPKWKAALETDFDGESAKLGKLMGSAVNTADKVGDLGKRKDEGQSAGTGINAINSAVHAYAKEHGLDLRDGGQYRTAFNAVQEAKPELFE